MTQSSLIPRAVLFGNPDRAAVQLSPDGAWLSYIAPHENVLNIWVAPRHDLSQAVPITQDTGRGIRSYSWAYTNQHILYVQDRDGDENWVLYRVSVKTGECLALTPAEGVHARLTKMSPTQPEEVIVSLNDRVPELHDLYRLNILTGQKSLIYQNEGFAGFILDESYHLRFGMKPLPDGGAAYLQRVAESEWAPFLDVAPEDVMTTSLLGLTKDQEAVYMIDSRGRNTAAFQSMKLATREVSFLSDNPRADVADILFHPTEKTPLAVAATYDRQEWHFLDQRVQRDFQALQKIQEGDVEILSQTQDNRHWIVGFIEDDGPVAYYDYDRDQQKATFLFTNREALKPFAFQKMHSVFIKSRDDLTLVSYLTLPETVDPEGTGRAAQPVPLILDVHGGPRARGNWGFSAFHQWLANRGYAVLSVNYRGSTGFGKDFMNAGNGEWGRKMHDDLLDAKAWAVQEGITQDHTVCLFGGSYGGYATLVGLTMTPEAFACGVDIVGPSNLITLANSIPAYWKPARDMMKVMLGADPDTEAGRHMLAARAPLTYHHQITKPLLIGQGANDPRVKQAESDQIVAALKSKKIPVTYALYPDEGHGFSRPENRLSFYGVMENFLAQHLGGDAQPLSREEVTQSTLDLQEGSDLIRGMAS